MNARFILAAVISATAVLATTGCAVTREQESVGAYIDDSALTARVKSAFASDPTVSAMSISVETMKGVVQLSGFAKSTAERSQADAIARGTGGVKAVRNDIVVRP
ncbi:BON domain-containing protein [Ideonella azotifigens]|uniref:BON domain-containing protein n=1 Tax=Ideonella azotifigens TaxID=513160 RepID=A0ABN1JQQ0_9BURK|nr:BON domain-containing protein [Ideonella azotifigens]MCD2340129.1 BON domain-containing protein [Ideonella azotifigens]